MPSEPERPSERHEEPGQATHPAAMAQPAQLSGRRRQAARNDATILSAARDVFVAEPSAPIAAVAQRAGVGISALYRRYPSKEALLGQLCSEGQAIYIQEAERALADPGDAWAAYTTFLRRIVAADTHALSTRLAGRFTPTDQHLADARRLQDVGQQLFDRTARAGLLREGLTFLDVGFMLEAISNVRVIDPARTGALRQRLLDIVIAGIRAGVTAELPGDPPSWEEQNERWIPR